MRPTRRLERNPGHALGLQDSNIGDAIKQSAVSTVSIPMATPLSRLERLRQPELTSPQLSETMLRSRLSPSSPSIPIVRLAPIPSTATVLEPAVILSALHTEPSSPTPTDIASSNPIDVHAPSSIRRAPPDVPHCEDDPSTWLPILQAEAEGAFPPDLFGGFFRMSLCHCPSSSEAKKSLGEQWCVGIPGPSERPSGWQSDEHSGRTELSSKLLPPRGGSCRAVCEHIYDNCLGNCDRTHGRWTWPLTGRSAGPSKGKEVCMDGCYLGYLDCLKGC
jgi:hypothetical protein